MLRHRYHPILLRSHVADSGISHHQPGDFFQFPWSEPSSTTMCSHALKLCAATEFIVSHDRFNRFLVGVMTKTIGRPLNPSLALNPRLAHDCDGK